MITYVTMETTRQLQRKIKTSKNSSLLWALFNDISLLGLKFDKFKVCLPTVEFLDLVWKIISFYFNMKPCLTVL